MPHARLAESTFSLKNILFATDFSRQSRLALTFALPITRKYGATIYAAHIVPEQIGLPVSAREGLRAIGVRRGNDTQESEGLRAQLCTIPHEILSRKGDVWTELAKIVETSKIDLIVTGTHGRSGVGKLVMGSVAEKIFRRASCPVLTVGPGVCGAPDVDLHQILFATDLSAVSVAALPYAISLAEENNARLYILHVAEKPVEAAGENALRDRLHTLVPQGAKLTSQPKVIVEYGPPAERVLAVAEELAMDLIVLGVKRTPVHFEASPRLPLATAYKVVSQAICPVLTVRG
jgi:nucleotide-binding universal stress UspA family protein